MFNWTANIRFFLDIQHFRPVISKKMSLTKLVSDMYRVMIQAVMILQTTLFPFPEG